MNIIVKPYDSDLCYCRPDTTWERENKDFYSPECVNQIQYSPILFARISKAGKCIGEKFASRYYDGVGCGILMYCQIEGHQDMTSCVDHTSILPHPLYNPVVLEDDDKSFALTRIVAGDQQNRLKDSIVLCEAKNMIELAICKASQLTSLRIGDFVAVEVDSKRQLVSRPDGKASISGHFCENESFNIQIIF